LDTNRSRSSFNNVANPHSFIRDETRQAQNKSGGYTFALALFLFSLCGHSSNSPHAMPHMLALKTQYCQRET